MGILRKKPQSNLFNFGYVVWWMTSYNSAKKNVDCKFLRYFVIFYANLTGLEFNHIFP